jgi:spore coat protein CotF
MAYSLSPQSIAIDCLNSSKFLALTDAFEVLECSTPQIKDIFARMNQQHITMADEWYRLMARKGWYQTTQVRPELQSQVSSHINNLTAQMSTTAYTQPGAPAYQYSGQPSSFPTVISPQM